MRFTKYLLVRCGFFRNLLNGAFVLCVRSSGTAFGLAAYAFGDEELRRLNELGLAPERLGLACPPPLLLALLAEGELWRDPTNRVVVITRRIAP
jgi:hypothetical protein